MLPGAYLQHSSVLKAQKSTVEVMDVMDAIHQSITDTGGLSEKTFFCLRECGAPE